jgi:uncharacterized protein (DUF697 family)
MTSSDPNSQPDATFQAIQAAADSLYQFIEQSTDTVGRIVTPIAESPLIKFATRMPGISWLMAALGQVDADKVRREVEELRRTYPLETAEQLAERVIVETSWRAAGIGLVTNFAPPLALLLFAVDLGAIAALQAGMIYKIAAIYGFPTHEPSRRGEVLAIWGLSAGGSSVLKAGLSIVELLPGVGAAIGITSDAALLYGLGYLASRFYETKLRSVTSSARDGSLGKDDRASIV